MTFEDFEDWFHGHKSRACTIQHDNGYGANEGWEVEIWEGKRYVRVTGVEFLERDDEWPTLPMVLEEAIKRVELP